MIVGVQIPLLAHAHCENVQERDLQSVTQGNLFESKPCMEFGVSFLESTLGVGVFGHSKKYAPKAG